MTHLSDFLSADPANAADTDDAIAGRAAALLLDQQAHWATYYAPLVTLWQTLIGTTDEKLAVANARLADDGVTPWWATNGFSSSFGYPDLDAAGELR